MRWWWTTRSGGRLWSRAVLRPADRIGDLGGTITADPRQLINRAPGEAEFTIPDCSDPRAIVTYALQRLNIIISAYQEIPGPRSGARRRKLRPRGQPAGRRDS